MPDVDAQYGQKDFQFDFSGGENSVADKVLVRANQATRLLNLLSKRGGGLEVRGGYKAVNGSTGQGRWIKEFDITTGQILSYVDVGANWYEDTNSPRFRVLGVTPQVNDAFYFGGTLTKFNQILLNFIIYLTVVGDTFVWEISDGAGGWIDHTADVTESVANAKQMRPGAVGEVLFSWPNLADWLPQQVETRNYGYWWRVRCTAAAMPPGQDVVLGRPWSDWFGQRKLLIASTTALEELPGLTITKRGIEAYQLIDRMDGVVMNDHLYYHSDGQRPLKRWNFARGIRRDGNTNNPVNTGITRPTTNVALTSTPGVAVGYLDNVVLSYCASYVEGPLGVLGEGRPSDQTAAAATITLPAAGAPHRVNIDFTAIRDSALAYNVHQIRLYATRDLAGKDPSERTNLSNYLLIKVITRDDATWNTGIFQDTNVERIVTGVATPIDYDPALTIKPKYIAVGGERCWVADDHFIYTSHIRRADSYDPRLSWEFPRIRNIHWWKDRMVVFGDQRIWAIRGINTGLPYVEDFYLGLGLSQPNSLTVCDGALRFVSHRGPAQIVRENEVELLAVGRVFESSNYWNARVGEGRIAQGAYFEDRWWIPVDRGATASPATHGSVAVYDAIDKGWSYTAYKGTGGLTQGWGTLAVIHGTLEHATSGQRILVGFPDGAIAGDADDLCILQYGTTDQWVADEWDGQEPTFIFESRALTMAALHRTKSFKYAHSRVKFPYSDVANTVSMLLLADVGVSNGRSIASPGNNIGGFYVDLKIELNPTGGAGGPFEENAPALRIAGSPDKGLSIIGWWVDADVEEFAVDHQV